jgi:hypothetical protein
MPPRRLSPEERIIEAPKRLNLTMQQIREAMAKGRGDLRHPLSVPKMRGQLRLSIRCRNDSPASWAMSVILYSHRFDGRIGCIDWEGLYVTMDGGKASGFHCHVSDPKAMHCEELKRALPQFKPTRVEEFILQGSKLLGIRHEEDSSDDRTQMSLN